MSTPIVDFLNEYTLSKQVRAHMPGHKGKSCGGFLDGVLPFDITEIKGADSLFEADGIIGQSEENTSRLYNTVKTLYSAGGSSLGIITMLALAVPPKSTVIASRNAHRAFLNACAVLDLNVKWVYPREGTSLGIVSADYRAEDFERALLSVENPGCVYVTSPDYYGRTSDIKGISSVCRKFNIPLLVDNAHGAHLAFLEENCHPIHLGADMCCDSAHKTLPALTGASYLHLGNPLYAGRAKDTMAMFASTSPSYLILASLDICGDYLEGSGREEIKSAARRITDLKSELSYMYDILDSEPFHMTVNANHCGISGRDMADYLSEYGIECEYCDERFVVLIFSSMTTKDDLKSIKEAFLKMKMPKIAFKSEKVTIPRPQKAMSIRKAAFAPCEEIDIDAAKGRICGLPKVPCPPGIPVAVSGEKIDDDCINILKRYSIFKINVVK